MPQRFDNFFHSVEGNEAERCHYPTRLDTYGCGCQHNCAYCYAKSLLAFRGLWNAQQPAAASLRKIRGIIVRQLFPGDVVRLGGMTDCLQPLERAMKRTLKTIEMLNQRHVHYLIVTKSDLVAAPEYLAAMDRRLAHIQVSITSTRDEISRRLEPGAPLPAARIAAVEKLAAEGFDVSVRLSPFVPEFVDLEKINGIACDKILVEFPRVNAWIEKWLANLGADLSQHTRFSSGYKHLPLNRKRGLLAGITGYPQVSVCEDVPEDWDFWHDNVNHNPDDCCNLNLTQYANQKD